MNSLSIPSHLRALVRRVAWLRSGFYLLYEVQRAILDSAIRDRKLVNSLYDAKNDPYKCLSEVATECYAKQLAALDIARKDATFKRVLEIGCSEGVFTEQLEPRCEKLIAVDISTTALRRAAMRRSWGSSVRFEVFDLRRESILGNFDLIVASGVLEYFHRPSVLWAVRAKLVRAVAIGGFLLIDTTRGNAIVEEAMWGKVLPRGRRINEFFKSHPNLEVVSEDATSICLQTLFQRTH